MSHPRSQRGFGRSQEPNQDDSDASYTSSTLPVRKVRFTSGRGENTDVGSDSAGWRCLRPEAPRGICWLLDTSAVSREMTLLHPCSPRNLAGSCNP